MQQQQFPQQQQHHHHMGTLEGAVLGGFAGEALGGHDVIGAIAGGVMGHEYDQRRD